MKHEIEIEIEGLPEGWRAVAYRVPKMGEFAHDGEVICEVSYPPNCSWLIVEKIMPRRIVLEETEEGNKMVASSHKTYATQRFQGGLVLEDSAKIWREVKECE